MNETAKTLICMVAALAVVVVAWATGPKPPSKDAADQTGQLLVQEFDPLAIGSLEILDFDENTGTAHPFKVEKVDVNGKTRWSIPSKWNYPTDAKDQFSEVAGNLTGLKILGMAGEGSGKFSEFGVVDPKDAKSGDTGVGKRIVVKDDKGGELLALILGKEVTNKTTNRYVRRAGEDQIYEVTIKTDKFSTKFDNWIEKNLLGLNAWDLKDIYVRDYSVDAMQGALLQRGEFVVQYNDAETPKWKLAKDERFEPGDTDPAGKWVPAKLAANEELNTARLDELKTALDDLKIVDVRRKPKGLSADLKASADFIKSKETVDSLGSCGFYAAKLDGKIELFSNNGETRIDMKDGVQYVLRFGSMATDSSSGPSDKGDKKAAGVNRYLFVTAEMNKDAIARPELEPLPSEEKMPEEKKAEEKKSDDAQAEEKKPEDAEAFVAPKAEAPKADEPKADEKKTDEKKPDPKQIEALQKRNKQKMDAYEATVKKGEEHVKELNARFADWYYVISEDVYKKIHLTREDIVKKKDAEKDKDKAKGEVHEDGAQHADPEQDPTGAFDAMKQEGLKE